MPDRTPGGGAPPLPLCLPIHLTTSPNPTAQPPSHPPTTHAPTTQHPPNAYPGERGDGRRRNSSRWRRPRRRWRRWRRWQTSGRVCLRAHSNIARAPVASRCCPLARLFHPPRTRLPTCIARTPRLSGAAPRCVCSVLAPGAAAAAQWYYLDARRQRAGPVSEEKLASVRSPPTAHTAVAPAGVAVGCFWLLSAAHRFGPSFSVNGRQ